MPAIGNANRYGEHRLEDVLAGWTSMNKERLGLRGRRRIRLESLKSKTGDGSSPIILRLNPRFLEWLMNWPAGWANPSLPIERRKLGSWETASCQAVLRSLSRYFSEGQLTVCLDPTDESFGVELAFPPSE